MLKWSGELIRVRTILISVLTILISGRNICVRNFRGRNIFVRTNLISVRTVPRGVGCPFFMHITPKHFLTEILESSPNGVDFAFKICYNIPVRKETYKGSFKGSRPRPFPLCYVASFRFRPLHSWKGVEVNDCCRIAKPTTAFFLHPLIELFGLTATPEVIS